MNEATGGMKIVVTAAGDDMVPSDIDSPSASDAEPEEPKNKNDYQAPEVKRISKVLRTFVMLQLTREYKKSNEQVPADLKTKLPGAVKEPSKFISKFLKQKEKIDTLEGIFESLKKRFVTDDITKQEKYKKKSEVTKNNYAQLTATELKEEFNKEQLCAAHRD